MPAPNTPAITSQEALSPVGEGSAVDVSAVLKAAADLLDRPGAWTQHFYGRDERGVGRFSISDECVSFCTIGAVAKAAALGVREVETLARLLDPVVKAIGIDGAGDLADWNDDPARTREDVVATLRAAALEPA